MLNSFIDKLSLRLNSENNLSDVTWALAETSPLFKKYFLQYFFDEIKDVEQVNDFCREYCRGECRPDFFFTIYNREYIIESKIYDSNHHFEQYRMGFPHARIGYITNYYIPQREEYEIRTWEGLSKFLLDKLELNEVEGVGRELIIAYINFVHKVCSIFKFEKMKLDSFTSLTQFNKLTQNIVTSIQGFNSSLNGKPKSFDDSRSGWYFNLNKPGSSITIIPWLGVWYNGQVYIYMEFNQNGCPQVHRVFDKRIAKTGEYFEAPYLDNEYNTTAVLYELKKEKFNEFNADDTSIERQQAIIRNFVSEVLSDVDNDIDWGIVKESTSSSNGQSNYDNR